VNIALRLLIIFLLTSGSHQAQVTPLSQNDSSLTEASTEKVDVLTTRINQIDAMLKEAISQDHIPGVVAIIVKDGIVIYHEAHGTANDTGGPLKRNVIFRITSQTKAINATAVMMNPGRG